MGCSEREVEERDIGGFGHETVTTSQWLHFDIRQAHRRGDETWETYLEDVFSIPLRGLLAKGEMSS